MDKEFFKTIESRILELLPKEDWLDKGVVLEDCCSEMARLVASWISEYEKSARFFILKGDEVCKTKRSHDVLVLIMKNGEAYLIDPTVWQFFPQEKSILVGKSDSLENLIVMAKTKYGGNWKVGEELKDISHEEEKEWLRIIKKNIEEIKN